MVLVSSSYGSYFFCIYLKFCKKSQSSFYHRHFITISTYVYLTCFLASWFRKQFSDWSLLVYNALLVTKISICLDSFKWFACFITYAFFLKKCKLTEWYHSLFFIAFLSPSHLSSSFPQRKRFTLFLYILVSQFLLTKEGTYYYMKDKSFNILETRSYVSILTLKFFYPISFTTIRIAQQNQFSLVKRSRW